MPYSGIFGLRIAEFLSLHSAAIHSARAFPPGTRVAPQLFSGYEVCNRSDNALASHVGIEQGIFQVAHAVILLILAAS